VDGTPSFITVNITGTNDAAIISTANVSIPEGNAPISTGGILTAPDVDNPDDSFIAQSNIDGSNGHGKFSIDANGNWTYTANSAFNELNVGDTLTDTFNVESIDGTVTSIIVNITGTNDAAIVSSASVSLPEADAPISTSGTLTAQDFDNPINKFISRSNVAGDHGIFSIDTDGNWTYTANDAYNGLNVGEILTDTFNVQSIDGTVTSVVVSITGTNDAAILGSATMQINEGDSILSTNGTLSISDVDNPQTYQPQTNIAGNYGKFTILSNGEWSYITNTAHNEFSAGHTYTETFDVTSSDGTTTSVVINIEGTDDAAIIEGASFVTEEQGVAHGSLNIVDVDSPTTFQVVSSPELSMNGYGTYKINAEGHWVYNVDNNHPAVKALNNGGQLMDTFMVVASDGTQKMMTVAIIGDNGGAVVVPPPSSALKIPKAPGSLTSNSNTTTLNDYMNSLKASNEPVFYESANAEFYNPMSFQVSNPGSSVISFQDLKASVSELNKVVSDLQNNNNAYSPLEKHLRREVHNKLNGDGQKFIDYSDQSNSNKEQQSMTKQDPRNQTELTHNSQDTMTLAQKSVYTQQMNFEQKIKAILSDFGLDIWK
jgi:VCBS repeat-containing protein